MELDQVPEIAGRAAVQVQASPCIGGGLDYTEQEEGSHRTAPGQVEESGEVEGPDRVAGQVVVADEEQQLVGDQEDSYLLNCHQPGEILIACVKRHHCKRILLKEDKTDRIENLDCNSEGGGGPGSTCEETPLHKKAVKLIKLIKSKT